MIYSLSNVLKSSLSTPIAIFAFRYLRYPKLLLSLVLSTRGSSTKLTNCCKHLSVMVGIPKGLFLSLSLGIHILRTGEALYSLG